MCESPDLTLRVSPHIRTPSSHSPMDQPDKHLDVFRDTPIRYLGYANEVGEAFRSLVPGWVVGLSYAVASSYVLADTLHKSHHEYQTLKKEHVTPEVRRKEVSIRAADTLVWQGLASVAIPGFTINRICAATAYLLRRQFRLPLTVQKWTTTGIGLASIPFIIKPIDHGVHWAMDSSIRPALGIPAHLPPLDCPPPQSA